MNVQQTIINGIKEHLFLNTYLVVPGFGGFVLKHHPAHFSLSGGMLNPASKTVSFNTQLKQNDGILALWLQNKLKCTPAQAIQHLLEFADYCKGVLQTKRRLTFDSIGFFYLDFENNICFEPLAGSNFLTDSFGLGPLAVSEIEAESIKPRSEPVFADRVVTIEAATLAQPSKRRTYRFIAPLVLGLVFFGTLILLVGNQKISGNLRAAIFGTSSKSIYTPMAYPALALANNSPANPDYVVDANGIASLSLDAEKSVAVRVLEAPAAKVSEVFVNKGHRLANYEIVLGCFNVLSNAKRMAKNLSAKNINAEVSEKNHKGMHVVSIGNFASKEEASQKLLEVKNEFPKAWIKQP